MQSQELFSLEHKIALVTGACGLLGKEYCLSLSRAGADVIVADLDLKACQRLTTNLSGDPLALELDVRDKFSLAKARKKIMDHYGKLDILVNNAAINDKFEDPDLALEQSRFENYPLEMWQQSMDVNLTGVFLSCQVLGSIMADQGSGSVINIASTYGVVGPDQNLYVDEKGQQIFYKTPSYPATKAALINFSRYLASYWGDKGVRVNCLSPGGVENGQDQWFVSKYSSRTLLGRMATPQDYNGALVFMASDASAYMTGANLIVDGGWTAI